MTPAVILCGGRGTRLREMTDAVPKVLIEIGGRPILWHVLMGYASRGYSDFVLALGYLGDQVIDYFESNRPKDWNITYVDTGLDTNTGGRIARVKDLIGDSTFFATYGDGLSDVDLDRLLAFHQAHGRVASLTAVRPRLPFGVVDVDTDDRVRSFREKPRIDGRINGGFFVFSPRVFDYLDGDQVLEAEPMSRLAAEGELMAYRHDGFWQCMDTYKDALELNSAWESGQAPWMTWGEQ